MPRRAPGGSIGRNALLSPGVVGLGEHNVRAAEGSWPRPTSEAASPAAPWTRPSDWIALPSIANTEQKWAGVVAIYPGTGTRVAFSCAGNYTVDWGDGTAAQNISSGQLASRLFDYGSVSAGTLTSEGFKQLLITVTMQGAANLTSINFRPSTGSYIVNNGPWTDILISAPNLTALTLGSSGAPQFSLLQRFVLLSSALTTYSQMFRGGFTALQSVEINTTGTVTSAADMFAGCSALTKAPVLPSVATITDFSNMFSGCRGLIEVPFYNTAAATTVYSMFQNCSALLEVPGFNFSSIASGGNGLNDMFNGCSSLRRVGPLRVGGVTTAQRMFQQCYALDSIPAFNTASVTNFTAAFANCISLREAPALNTAAATNMASMFGGCPALRRAPAYSTSLVTTFFNMFEGCASLESVPLYNMSAALNVSSMFAGCRSLRSVPAFNLSSATNVSSMFNNCQSLLDAPEFTITAATSSAASMFSGCSALRSLDLVGAATSGAIASNTSALRRIGNIDQSAVTAASTSWPANSTMLISSDMSGMRYSISYGSTSLSSANMNTVMDNLGIAINTSQQFTLPSGTTYPSAEIYSTTATTTSGSTSITVTSATGIAVGQEVGGTGISTAVAVTFQDTGDTVTRTAHGLSNDTRVSFATIVSTTGIAVYTPYYVVNATTDTFQVSLTQGGGALALTTNGSGTMLYGTTVTNVSGTTITLSAPASATGSVTATFSPIKRSIARLKGWTVVN